MIKNVIVYDSTTGEILRSVASPDPKSQVKPGEAYINTPDDPQKYLKGWKVDLTSKDLVSTEIATDMKDVLQAIQAKATDAELDQVIEKIPGVTNVSQWRAENYQILRYNNYPPIVDFIDAQVKINSTDPVLNQEGKAQLQEYLDKCLSLKAKYSKPAEKAL